MAGRAYANIQVKKGVNISSTCHYFGSVVFTYRGRRFVRDVDLNGWGVLNDLGGQLIIPQYAQAEVDRQFIALLKTGAVFFEYDRDGNKRYENLRYHGPENLADVIKCLEAHLKRVVK